MRKILAYFAGREEPIEYTMDVYSLLVTDNMVTDIVDAETGEFLYSEDVCLDLYRYGKILEDKNGRDGIGVWRRVSIIEMDGKLYRVKMVNGKCVGAERMEAEA